MDIDAIVQWLVDFVQSIADYLVQLVQYIWNVLVAVGNFLWGVLQDVFHYAWSFLKSVASLFRSLWDNFFKKIFTAVWNAIQTAQQWLEKIFGPVVKFLKMIRDFYDRWFKYFIKPLLNFLQLIRNVIKVLDFLHIHVLDSLDKVIAKIEQKITTAVLTIRGVLNGLIDIVSILADPLNIIRHPTIVYSIRRTALGLVKIFTGLPPGFFLPSPLSGAQKGTGLLPANFNPNDPSQNPPASSYMGSDGLPSGWDGFLPGVDVPMDAVNALATLDFFNCDNYPSPTCNNVGDCLQQAFDSILSGV